MHLDLVIPRGVRLNNVGLTFTYMILLSLAWIFLAVYFFAGQNMRQAYSLAGQVQVTMWSDLVYTLSDDASGFNSNLALGPVCQNPQRFRDAASANANTSFSCMGICSRELTSLKCMPAAAAVVVDPMENSVFFTTHIEEWIREPNTTISASAPDKPAHYLLPLDAIAKFNFFYTFNLIGEKELDNLWSWSGYTGSSMADVATVFLNSKQKQARIQKPSPSIAMTLAELLQLAGEPNLLETSSRTSGVVLELVLKCGAHSNSPNIELGEWRGEFCVATVERVPSPKPIRRPGVVHMTNKKRELNSYGVLIRTRTVGLVRVLSVSRICVFFVQALVFLQLPMHVCRLIATYCLGQLSRVYKGLISQHTSIAEHVSSLAMQIMSTKFIYDTLAGPTGISVSKVSQELSTALSDFPELDASEIDKFAWLSFMQVRGLAEKSYSPAPTADPESDFASFQADIDKDPGGISFKAFMSANSVMSGPDMEDGVKIFDQDRRIGILERMYMPFLGTECSSIVDTSEVTAEEKQTFCSEAGDRSKAPREIGDSKQSDSPQAPKTREQENAYQTRLAELESRIMNSIELQQSRLDELRNDVLSRIERIEISCENRCGDLKTELLAAIEQHGISIQNSLHDVSLLPHTEVSAAIEMPANQGNAQAVAAVHKSLENLTRLVDKPDNWMNEVFPSSSSVKGSSGSSQNPAPPMPGHPTPPTSPSLLPRYPKGHQTLPTHQAAPDSTEQSSRLPLQTSQSQSWQILPETR